MDVKKYKIKWFVGAVGLKAHTTISLGFCERTKRVAFISVGDLNEPITLEGMRPLVIHDVYCSGNRCEDADCCLDLMCSFNVIEPLRLKRYLGKVSRKEVESFSGTIQEFGDLLKRNVKIDWTAKEDAFFVEPPIKVRRKT